MVQMNWLSVKKNIAYFLSSEFFTDALRTVISILLPVWILFEVGSAQMAIAVGIGTLLTSLTDSSGTYDDKRTISWVSVILFFIVALTTSFCWPYPWLMGAVLFIFCVSFSMLTALGNRFSMVGTTAIALCVFISGLRPEDGFQFSAYILVGGVFYYVVSLLQAWLWPFRSLRQAVAECIMATASYMKARTAFYNHNIPLDECYHNIIPLHTLVSERQENVRDLLLRDRLAMRPDNSKGQQMLRIAMQVIDLYEHITTVHFDYQHFRQAFGVTGALEIVSRLIEIMSIELEQAGHAFYLNKPLVQDQHTKEVAYLESRLNYVIQREEVSNQLLLTDLHRNIKDISGRITQLRAMLAGSSQRQEVEGGEPPVYQDFLTYRPQSIDQLKLHFNLRSPILRFALRLAVACVFAFCLGRILPLGKYSYWIMLTVVVIMKPAYSITRQRNKQRLIGTLIGVGMGLLLLALIHNTVVLLIIALVFLLGFFTFARSRYALSVMFITPMVMLCLHIYSGRQTLFILERVYDTLIGCGIALAASYLFPVWEHWGITNYIREVIRANYAYLENLQQRISGKRTDHHTYKLIRKNVYTKLADLSAAFQRAMLEPDRTRVSVEDMQRFQALNHQLYGTVASLSSNGDLDQLVQPAHLRSVNDALSRLKLGIDAEVPLVIVPVGGHLTDAVPANEASQGNLTQQFNSILATATQLEELSVRLQMLKV